MKLTHGIQFGCTAWRVIGLTTSKNLNEWEKNEKLLHVLISFYSSNMTMFFSM